MTEVRIVNSLKYGWRAFAYFLGATALGGGGVALGVAVGYNAATVRGTGGNPVIYDTSELIAGVVLVSLGGAVLLTGLFGLIHKLIADSVATGLANGSVSPGMEFSESQQASTGAVGTAAEQSADAKRSPRGTDSDQPAASAGRSGTETTTEQTANEASSDQQPERSHAPQDPTSGGTASQRAEDAAEFEPKTTDDHSGEGTTSQTAASGASGGPSDPTGDPPQRGEEDPDEEFRERTAEQIAFGEGHTDPEAASTDTAAGTSGGGGLADESEPTTAAEESGETDEAASGSGGFVEEHARTADDPEEFDTERSIEEGEAGETIEDRLDEEQAVEESLGEGATVGSDYGEQGQPQEEGSDTAGEPDQEGGEDSEEDAGTVVPEYDEITDETGDESAEESSGDPLGEPFENDSS
jgi:hypothetical protein